MRGVYHLYFLRDHNYNPGEKCLNSFNMTPNAVSTSPLLPCNVDFWHYLQVGGGGGRGSNHFPVTVLTILC